MHKPSYAERMNPILFLFVGIFQAFGLAFEPTQTYGGKTLLLNGVGVREATVFNVDVYEAALYLSSKESDAEVILKSPDPKYLSLRFVRDVEAQQMKEAFVEGFQKNCNWEACAALKPSLAKIIEGLCDMKSGSQMGLAFSTGEVTLFIENNEKARASGARFDEALLRLWLGEPPNAGLKKGLLGS